MRSKARSSPARQASIHWTPESASKSLMDRAGDALEPRSPREVPRDPARLSPILSAARGRDRRDELPGVRGGPDDPDRAPDDPRSPHGPPFAAVAALGGVVAEDEVLVGAQVLRRLDAVGVARGVVDVAQDPDRSEDETSALSSEADAR